MNVKLSDIVKDTCIIICDTNEQLKQVCVKLDELISASKAQKVFDIEEYDKHIVINDKEYTTFFTTKNNHCKNKFLFHQININK